MRKSKGPASTAVHIFHHWKICITVLSKDPLEKLTATQLGKKFPKDLLTCRYEVFHKGDYDINWSSRSMLTFQRNILAPSSESKCKPNKNRSRWQADLMFSE
jgi:hypothetical protein